MPKKTRTKAPRRRTAEEKYLDALHSAWRNLIDAAVEHVYCLVDYGRDASSKDERPRTDDLCDSEMVLEDACLKWVDIIRNPPKEP